MKKEDIVSNKDIAEHFQCSNQGGVRKSHKSKSVIVIAKFIPCSYKHWKEKEILYFVGIGKRGNQELKRANKSLFEAKKDDYSIHLFEMYKDKEYTYKGKVEIIKDIFSVKQDDDDGNERDVLVFPLKEV